MVALILLEPLSIASKIFIAKEIFAGLLLITTLLSLFLVLLIALVFVQEASHRLRDWMKERAAQQSKIHQARAGWPGKFAQQSPRR